MKLFCYGDDVPDRPCCSLDSINDARRVCEQLGVPHYVLNLESAFGRDVVDDFVDEYARGRTPIPCVRCNTFTKFRDLSARPTRSSPVDRDRALRARRRRRAASRPRHDQGPVYFLWGIDRSVVRRMLLPVGEKTKAGDARRRARARPRGRRGEGSRARTSASSPTATTRRSSRGGSAPMRRRCRAVRSCCSDGTVVGEHDGYARYTIGQRRGVPGGFREPMYVVGIRPDERAVVIGPRAELLGRGVVAREMNWLVEPPAVGAQRQRAGAPSRARRRRRRSSACDGGEIELALDEPVAAITPGQSLVLYDASEYSAAGSSKPRAARGRRCRSSPPNDPGRRAGDAPRRSTPGHWRGIAPGPPARECASRRGWAYSAAAHRAGDSKRSHPCRRSGCGRSAISRSE